jgi:predicted MFS family arabinose efflux permease
VLSPDLVRDLGIDASRLGLLTGAYFLAFALAQLPLGVLLDRFGPRRVNACLLGVAAAGAALFATGESLSALIAGRALIGLGVSACLMASIKAFTLWFPLSRLATLNGWLMASGGLGAIAASAPLQWLLGFTDWRGVFAGVAALALVAALLILACVPDRSDARATASVRELARGFGAIYRDPGFWRIAAVSTTVPAASLSLQGLWVAPWLRDVAGFERGEVAWTLFGMAICITLGFASQGTVADRLARRGVDAIVPFKWGSAASALLLFWFALGNTAGAAFAWCLLALLSPAASLGYAILTRRYQPELAGRVNTAVNLLVFLGAFAAQWGVGLVVDLWPAADGAHPPAAYGTAFGVLVLAETFALAPLFVWPERR